jgi:hypothetical protein
MEKFFVYSKGIPEGPYSIEEIEKKVAQKQFALSDLAYIEDKFKYVPLQEILESEEFKSLPNSTTNTVEEYKRVCQQCGKVWHSLISRENQIRGNLFCNSCSSASQAATCSPVGIAGAAQSNRSVEANQSELAKLQSCPDCNSTDFTQEIISYEKKKLHR